MTAARSLLVDVNVTRYYHCISRCVRQALLCGEGFEHRKQWIEDRLQTLAECFAASVCGFAVMDNICRSWCGWSRTPQTGGRPRMSSGGGWWPIRPSRQTGRPSK